MSESERLYDLDRLHKGYEFSDDEMRLALGGLTLVERNTDDYKFRLMNVVESLRQDLINEGKYWVVSTVKGRIRILSDEESSVSSAKGVDRCITKMVKHVRYHEAVDVDNLSDEQAEIHERRKGVNRAIVTNLATTVKALPREPEEERPSGLFKLAKILANRDSGSETSTEGEE